MAVSVGIVVYLVQFHGLSHGYWVAVTLTVVLQPRHDLTRTKARQRILGTVGGVVLGALFLGIIKNALPVIGISPFWQMAISGAIIIVAVVINARGERVKGRVILRRKELPL